MKKSTSFAEAFSAVKKYRMITESTEKEVPFWETAWKKAAASSAITWPQEFISHKGTYKIEIMQSEEDKNKGMIVVTILKNKENLEGRIVSVSDGKGHKLLEGKIKESRIYNSDLNLEDIDLKLLVHTLD